MMGSRSAERSGEDGMVESVDSRPAADTRRHRRINLIAALIPVALSVVALWLAGAGIFG